jgi:hypothetical protein
MTEYLPRISSEIVISEVEILAQRRGRTEWVLPCERTTVSVYDIPVTTEESVAFLEKAYKAQQGAAARAKSNSPSTTSAIHTTGRYNGSATKITCDEGDSVLSILHQVAKPNPDPVDRGALESIIVANNISVGFGDMKLKAVRFMLSETVRKLKITGVESTDPYSPGDWEGILAAVPAPPARPVDEFGFPIIKAEEPSSQKSWRRFFSS